MKFNALLVIYALYFIARILFDRTLSIVRPSTRFSLEFLDVGQGDSILITTQEGKTILIDGGPDFEADSYLFRKWPLGQCFIDAVILTHPHADHKAGLDRILRRCKVGVYKNLYQGEEFSLDGVNFYVLWPPENYKDQNPNNISEVILVQYKDFDVLLTGDAESSVLSLLDWKSLKKVIRGELEVYKVPHHGSITGLNRDFLRDFMPKYSIVSVGTNNSFGLPDEEVLYFLEEIGSDILRTDMAGNIEMKVF